MTKVLVLVKYFKPAYRTGGPAKAVNTIVSKLNRNSSTDIQFSILTKDRDSGDKKPFSSVEIDAWNMYLNNTQVKYVDESKLTIRRLWKEYLKGYECLYLNSLFSFKFSILPLMIAFVAKKDTLIVLAPRGELAADALKMGWLKKKMYLTFLRIFSLPQKIRWHTTNPFESEMVREKFGRNCIVSEIPDLVNPRNNGNPITQISTTNRDEHQKLRVVFLSRICKMKNLDFALRVFQRLNTSKPVIFDIYGPASIPSELKYLSYCKEIAVGIPKNVEVSFKGSILPEEVEATIAGYDLFFLPTLGENFGHVIFEALSAGVPVLLSDRTLWRNLELQSIGWDLPLVESNFVNVLNKILISDSSDLYMMKVKIRDFLVDYYDKQDLFAKSYENMLAS